MSYTRAARVRLDDALREYLFERGTKSVPIAELATVSNGARRVRLAAEAIIGMTRPHTDGSAPSTTSNARSPGLSATGDAVAQSAAETATSFRELADGLAPTRGTWPASLIGHASAEQGRNLWSCSLHLDDVTRLQAGLTASVAVLNQPGHEGTPAEIGPEPAAGGTALPSTVRAGSSK